MTASHEEKFEELSVNKQIEYVQKLWDKIAEDADEIELTTRQKKELNRRLDRIEEDNKETLSWDEVRASLEDDS